MVSSKKTGSKERASSLFQYGGKSLRLPRLGNELDRSGVSMGDSVLTLPGVGAKLADESLA